MSSLNPIMNDQAGELAKTNRAEDDLLTGSTIHNVLNYYSGIIASIHLSCVGQDGCIQAQEVKLETSQFSHR